MCQSELPVNSEAIAEETTPMMGKKSQTDVFSWGNDKNGQLGLGEKMKEGKQVYSLPKFCSYNIAITKMACGQEHSLFLTPNGLIYSMGSNSKGQLGINDP